METNLIIKSPSSGAIINNNFIYILGLPKCGTTATQSFISHLCKNKIIKGDTYQNICRYHEPVRLVKNIKSYIESKKLIIGNIRNPLDFYISLYKFYKHSPNSGWNHIVSKDFKSYLHHMMFKLDWSSFMDEFDGYRYKQCQQWKINNNLDLGFFTKRYINMFFINAIDILNNWNTDKFYKEHDKQITINSVCKQETLKNDIVNLLQINGKYNIEQLNKSKGNNNRNDYYDEESMGWVLKKDFIIFKNYYKNELNVQ